MQSATEFTARLRTIPTAHGDLVFGGRCLIMGILNVTPDSFSDGGHFFDSEAAVARALTMQADGADVVDIGGESTRPGSQGIPDDEQIRRVVPVIREARARGLTVPISIDTRSAAVAAAALDAGADVVNDISAARHDAGMVRLLAERDVPFILMHMQGTPETMQIDPCYTDVVAEVGQFFEECAVTLTAAGVNVMEKMIVDPGIGFGKTIEHNLALLRAAGPIYGEKWPVVVGTSRKRFISKLLNSEDETSRLFGTAATVAHAAMTGVNMVRVHDVREMSALVKMCAELQMGH